MKIAKEGWPFIGISAILTVLIYLALEPLIAFVPFLGTLFMVFFFRDPERTPEGEGFLSPADGRVITVRNTYEDFYLKSNALLISIFMSPFNVHVNRSPCDGKVVDVKYTKGRFFPAYREDAYLRNENTAILLECKDKKVIVRQVAGFLARRTVCRVKSGDYLKRGERFGIIRFGSRLDVYLPEGTVARVKVGERVRAGESVIGSIPVKIKEDYAPDF